MALDIWSRWFCVTHRERNGQFKIRCVHSAGDNPCEASTDLGMGGMATATEVKAVELQQAVAYAPLPPFVSRELADWHAAHWDATGVALSPAEAAKVRVTRNVSQTAWGVTCDPTREWY